LISLHFAANTPAVQARTLSKRLLLPVLLS
jgi:hypothetical protein